LPDILDPRVRQAAGAVRPRLTGERAVARADAIELIVVELLQIEQRIVRSGHRADQLVELDLERIGVAVLRALDQKHHQEGHDRRASVDHELPGIAEAEQRSTHAPEENNEHRGRECHRSPGQARRRAGEAGEA
jgi:hypothetical protein